MPLPLTPRCLPSLASRTPRKQACDGGDYQPAISYASKSGGSQLEAAYPYEGIDDFCRTGAKNAPGAPPRALRKLTRFQQPLRQQRPFRPRTEACPRMLPVI